ncbi:hypothetical protein SCHPADRAFT_939765 [Schizopora paradoxa]|uniref:Mid2 domain-containing protein n=1 Tax=Schizopora paradoxa TaxID=27342 RepID=A0A0H2RRI5_9AGAM|nr:hypothetical protein SCHPADRAFT_939765 [Schizopora paradoxa]
MAAHHATKPFDASSIAAWWSALQSQATAGKPSKFFRLYLLSNIIDIEGITLAESITATITISPTTAVHTTQSPTTTITISPTEVTTHSTTTSPTTTATRLESNDEATSDVEDPGETSSSPLQTTSSTIRIPLSSTTTSASETPGVAGFTTKASLSATFAATDVVGSAPTVAASTSHSSAAGAIAGGIIGGLIFLIFLAVVLIAYLRRRKRKRTAPSAEFLAFFKRHGSLLSTYRFRRYSQRSSAFNSLASEGGDSPISEKGDDEGASFVSDGVSEQTRVTWGVAV